MWSGQPTVRGLSRPFRACGERALTQISALEIQRRGHVGRITSAAGDLSTIAA